MLTLLLLPLLVSCRPLYIPAIPEEIPFTPQVRATGESLISFDAAGYPTVELVLRDVSDSGWLAVQWLAPNGNELASQSVWIEPAAEQRIEFTLPTDVELLGGEWRAVVSINGRLVRQLNFAVEPTR